MLREPQQRTTGAAGAEFATEAAIAALGFLADDPERLERFLALSGLGPQNCVRPRLSPRSWARCSIISPATKLC